MSQAALFNPVRHNPAHADRNSALSGASRQSGLAAGIAAASRAVCRSPHGAGCLTSG
jgi:hypothetical protein